MTYRLVLMDVTNPGKAEEYGTGFYEGLDEAKAGGLRAVWHAKKAGRRVRASIHYLNRHGRATHFQILDTRAMRWKDPIANKPHKTAKEEA